MYDIAVMRIGLYVKRIGTESSGRLDLHPLPRPLPQNLSQP